MGILQCLLVFELYICEHGEFTFSLRLPREFYFYDVPLAPKNRTFAAPPKGILLFRRCFAGTKKCVFPLRVPKGFCFSDASLALKTFIFAAGPKGMLLFRCFAGTQNSHFRCGSQGKSAFLTFRWYSRFGFSLRVPSGICFSDVSLVFKIRIFAAGPKRNLFF